MVKKIEDDEDYDNVEEDDEDLDEIPPQKIMPIKKPMMTTLKRKEWELEATPTPTGRMIKGDEVIDQLEALRRILNAIER